MTDLHELLRAASEPAASAERSPEDASHEIALGRRALRRRRLATGFAVTASTAVVATVAAGTFTFGGGGTDPIGVAGGAPTVVRPTLAHSADTVSSSPSPTLSAESEPRVTLIKGSATSGSYTFGLVPAGWEAGRGTTSAGNLVPSDGSTSESPDVFIGKITALLDAKTGGRDTVYFEDDDYWHAQRPVTVGGKQLLLTVQVPGSVGLTRAEVDRLADAVTVDDSATSGVG